MEEKRMELTESTLVEVISDYNGIVVLGGEKENRIFDPYTRKKLTLEFLKGAVFGRGSRKVFENNLLIIRDERVREELDLPPRKEFDLYSEEIKALLKTKDLEKLEEVLQYCSNKTLEKIVDVAINLPITDVVVGNLIRAYSGKDVLSFAQEKLENQRAETREPRKPEGIEPSDDGARRRIIRT